jgi:hypothetical protein
MAIQFFCAACHQPIEVDDDAANQSVTCPYCRKVVTAPFSSDPSVRMPSGGAMREAGPLGAAPQPASGGTLSPLTHGTGGPCLRDFKRDLHHCDRLCVWLVDRIGRN